MGRLVDLIRRSVAETLQKLQQTQVSTWKCISLSNSGAAQAMLWTFKSICRTPSDLFCPAEIIHEHFVHLCRVLLEPVLQLCISSVIRQVTISVVYLA
jgi:hypothetical protein